MGKWAILFLRSAIALSLCILMAAPLWAGPKVIRIAAVGDIMMGTENLLPDDGAAGAFAEVFSFLTDRQVVIGNLEGPLTNRGVPNKTAVEGQSYIFRTPPQYVERLKQAGFTIMSLANNHANDYGAAGYAQTTEVLEQAGILYTGGPGQWARQKVRKTTVSVLGLAPNSGCQDINDLSAAAQLVRDEAAKPNTIVVVTFHGGGEGGGYIFVPQGPEYFLGENRGDVRKLGREMVDAGAHLVIGHGPHVPRGMEIYKDRLIAYSLGNFVTGRGVSVSGYNGLAPLLLVELSAKGDLVGGRVVGFRQNRPGRASLDSQGETVRLMHALSLYDFTQPALNADGSILTSDKAALKMASSAVKPERPKALARARVTAEQAAVQPSDLAASVDSKDKKAAKKKAPTQYEWDIYSGSSASRN